MILHIITGLGDGGAEGVLYRLCKHDREHRHAVISLMDGGKYEAPLLELGIPVHSLGLGRGRVSLGAVWRLAKLIRHYKPDVVQTWLYHADLIGGTLARMLRVPRVSWGIRHGELPAGKTKRSTVTVARLCARLSRVVPDAIVSCSAGAKAIHADLGYDPTIFHVIPNGYEVDNLAPDAEARKAFRAELGVSEDMPLLGMVSRFSPQKDHPNLFRALSQLALQGRPFEVALVGTGLSPDNAELMQLAAELRLAERIHWLGRRNDIAKVMNGLDIHVLSSASEGFPNVVAEAMLCGTPCVVTDVGDAAPMVGQTGWVAPPSDSTALASATAQALDTMRDGSEWERRKAAARARVVSQYGIDAMVAAYHRVWHG